MKVDVIHPAGILGGFSAIVMAGKAFAGNLT
jgi:hypothetical protein